MTKNRVITKEVILSIADHLFLENGYERTNMRQIAAECNIAIGTLYNYYKNKREIFEAVYKSALDNTHQEIDKILERDLPANERLNLVLDQVYTETLGHNLLWIDKFALDLNDRYLSSQGGNSSGSEIQGLDIDLVQKVESLIREINGKSVDPSDTLRLARTLLDSVSVCFVASPTDHERNRVFLRWLT